MKRVMASNLKNYTKDTEFAYAPFLDILGTGLVTSNGEQWRKMRNHISKALRVDILVSRRKVDPRFRGCLRGVQGVFRGCLRGIQGCLGDVYGRRAVQSDPG